MYIKCNLRFSPPESLEMGEYCVWSSNKKSLRNCDAEIVLPLAKGKFSEISLIKSITRSVILSEVEESPPSNKPFCEKYPNLMVSPVSISPESFGSKP